MSGHRQQLYRDGHSKATAQYTSKFVMTNLTQAEGHLIGNHTYSHMQLTKKNWEKFKEELVRTNEVLEEIMFE